MRLFTSLDFYLNPDLRLVKQWPLRLGPTHPLRFGPRGSDLNTVGQDSPAPLSSKINNSCILLYLHRHIVLR